MITPSKNSFDAGKRYEDRTRKLIIKALTVSNCALSRRQISKCTALEISSLCQPLYDLLYKYYSIRVAYIRPCETTKKRVMFFALNKVKTMADDGSN